MTGDTRREGATLLDVLIDGFEKNEVLYGFHHRDLPMPDEPAAVKKFAALTDEATRWKGAPRRTEEHRGRRLSAWADLEIRQAGCGVMVRVRTPRFDDWWHESSTWAGSPMQELFEWLGEDGRTSSG
jgi:hypothetical protein